jgi:NarL family two-component system sensor histidine kinase LiaS
MPKLFRGLRWKLTLSYTVVTVVTLLAVEILIILGMGAIILHSNLLPGVLIYATETFITPQVTNYLDRPQPDVDSLTRWLESASTEGLTFQSSQNPRILFKLGDFEGDTRLAILDRNLIQLASIPESADQFAYHNIDDLLVAARRGESDPDLISRMLNGVLTIAVPATNEGGEVVGVVVMIMPYPPQDALTQSLSLIGGSLILFTITVGMIGTVFGYITSRGFTRRLNDVSLAADSWSRGDFSTFIQDRSGDEIGQLAKQLNRMAEQLQNLLQTKEELAALEERNRLARDLHDSVKQQVFATAMQVGSARELLHEDPGAAKNHLNAAQELARQAQAELNAILREFRPTSLKDKGLVQSLKESLDDWSRVNDIESEVRTKGEFPLSLEIEQALFRVSQEALSNIARHSQASQVGVELVVENDQVVMNISDDGIGFDIAAVEGKGVGLQSMRERVEAWGGNLRVESIPGQGTRLTAQIPLVKGRSDE